MEIKAHFNPIFKPVNASRHRYRVLKGSAGSGKSVNVAQDYILKLSDPLYTSANLLVVRKVEESNKDSTFAELNGAIRRIFGEYSGQYWQVKTNPMEMQSRVTGNKIIFRGFNDARQREKVKSITFEQGKLTWIWCEEATELLASDVDILDDRLRGILPSPALFYQMTFTFNPVSAMHWIKARFFDIENQDTMTHHSTYRDNRFIDPAYDRRMELRKILDPEGYKVYGLGEWGETGGLILTNYRVHDFPTQFRNFDAMSIGQDFGFNHANAILVLGWKDDEVYVCQELYVHEMDTEEIIAEAEKQKIPKNLLMWCDSAEADRIKTWRKAGYKARAVSKEQKGHGSVSNQIDWLKQRVIHIHPSCVNTQKEISQWKWKLDGKTNRYIDEPVNIMDDAMAALRYGVESWRKPHGIIFA